MVVCGGRGGQAAGVGGVRGLAGWGGVICQSEHRLNPDQVSLSGTEHEHVTFPPLQV